ncbi:hypothetical protein [Borrelia hermsii]|uniref:hypothetical protein n=1 Tax=Borrelia hermsii TaxID=140 RepID=UPI000ADF2453|nr:hypothetical protein [Borrelia hermsii]UPA08440.1 hypothetical protein bhDAH_001147 [Borrelia hermsii DAH]
MEELVELNKAIERHIQMVRFEDTIRDAVLSLKKGQIEKEEGIRKLLFDKDRII